MKGRIDAPFRILYWPGWWYPSRDDPLNGIFIRRHAEAISRCCPLGILYVNGRRRLKKRRETELLRESNRLTAIVYFREPPRIPLFSFLLYIRRYMAASHTGLRLLRKEMGGFQVLHMHINPPFGQMLFAMTSLRRMPCVFTEHWSGYQPACGLYRGFWRKVITRLFFRRIQAVTTVSRNLQQVMQAHGLLGDYRVIPNAVDEGLFLPAESALDERKKIFVHVSNLNPLKNVAGMIRAAAKLWETRDDFILLIVGDGEKRAGLEDLAAGLGLLDGRLFFTGRKEPKELARIFQSSHCLVMFSDYENSPCVIAEAQMAGLPVIATAVGGIPELVDAYSGLLVEPRDEQALLAAFSRMLDSIRLYDRRSIREKAIARHGYEAVGTMFREVYRRVLELQPDKKS